MVDTDTAPSRQADHSAEGDAQAPSSLRALIVEDNDVDYVLTRDLLSSLSEPKVVCEQAGRLDEALRRLNDEPPDVVLLDLRLPDADGLETLLRVRSRTPDTAIIVLTGVEDEALAQSAIRQGAQDYLVKGKVAREQIGRSVRYAVERARSQAALRRYREHLEELVAARTAELRMANEKLRQEGALRQAAEAERERLLDELMESRKLEAVGRLAGGIAHEFNNALTVVLGYTELLIERTAPNDPARAELERIRDGAQRAAFVTRQLLAFGRRQLLHTSTIPVNLFLDGMASILSAAMGERIILETLPCKDPVAMEVDEEQFKAVFINLAANARDAMPDGGRLTLQAESVIVDPPPEGVPNRTGGFVCFTVEDTGRGLDRQTLKHLFEPFFSNKTGRKVGLGLAVSYGIVRQHGGWITAENRPEGGARFRVYVPALPVQAAEPTVTPERTADRSPPTDGSGETILLVEDERPVRGQSVFQKLAHGYRVCAAESAAAAKALFETLRGECRALFSDVVLPDGDGLRLADELLRLAPHLKIVLTSGYPECDYRGAVIRQRGYGFLNKPYCISSLLGALRAAFDAGRPPSG